MDFLQFAEMLERAAIESPAAASLALKATLDAVTLEAKGYIGHELPEWPPLADSTIAQKGRLGFVGHLSATDPLLRSGDMRASIANEVAGLEGVVGSPDKVALWQELGTHNSKSGNIPPRPFLALAASRSAPVAEIFFGEAAVRLLSPPTARGLGSRTP
jgi:hypothetical protein